jgi:hypothetical protein
LPTGCDGDCQSGRWVGLGFQFAIQRLRADVEDNCGAAFAYLQFTTQRQQFEEQQKASRDLLISN